MAHVEQIGRRAVIYDIMNGHVEPNWLARKNSKSTRFATTFSWPTDLRRAYIAIIC